MKRGPSSLQEALAAVTKMMDKRGSLSRARAVEAWYRIAGNEIVSHTTGAGVRDGEMQVYVDNHAWANELALLAEHLRKRLNEELGEEIVRTLRFTVSREVARQREQRKREEENEEFYEPEKTPKVPLSDIERRQVEHSAAVIEDEELRNAAIRATIADLERKKGLRSPKSP